MDAAARGKQAAAEVAVSLIEDGMRLGLGTGSTMVFVLDAIARRVAADGLRVVGVPTSERTREQAKRLGIGLTDLSQVDALDLAIDGADEVATGTLDLVKGLGGALLREKIVASACRRFVGVVDPSKVVAVLGARAPLPVEVVTFGHQSTARHLAALGGKPVLRVVEGGMFRTDSGNVIYDCAGFAPIVAPEELAPRLTAVPGVVEHGLFLGIATQVLVGDPARGLVVLERE
jgi:ribose 5-phosphate isomerase A